MGMIAVSTRSFLAAAASPRQAHTYNNKYNTGSGMEASQYMDRSSLKSPEKLVKNLFPGGQDSIEMSPLHNWLDGGEAAPDPFFFSFSYFLNS